MLDRKLRMLSKEAAPDELMLNRDTRKVKKLFKTKKCLFICLYCNPTTPQYTKLTTKPRQRWTEIS